MVLILAVGSSIISIIRWLILAKKSAACEKDQFWFASQRINKWLLRAFNAENRVISFATDCLATFNLTPFGLFNSRYCLSTLWLSPCNRGMLAADLHNSEVGMLCKIQSSAKDTLGYNSIAFGLFFTLRPDRWLFSSTIICAIACCRVSLLKPGKGGVSAKLGTPLSWSTYRITPSRAVSLIPLKKSGILKGSR